jgi:hypothetical protein
VAVLGQQEARQLGLIIPEEKKVVDCLDSFATV